MSTPTDPGADALEALSARLAAGDITQAQHDAERVRVLEDIRTGRISVPAWRRAIAVTASVILIIAGALTAIALQSIPGLVIGGLFILAGVSGLRASR